MIAIRLISATAVTYVLGMVFALSGISPAAGVSAGTDGPAPGGKPERLDGRAIFRYDTFGDEQLWTDVLRMHEVIPSVDPATALAVGLKVDVDALPPAVIDAFVDSLDLTLEGFSKVVPEQTGRPPYDPGDLLKLYLYGYANQVRSSRRQASASSGSLRSPPARHSSA